MGLHGADIMLGAKWLKRLGLVLMNYNLITLTFIHNNACVKLKGDCSSPSEGFHQFQKITRADPRAQLFSIHIIIPNSQHS